MSIALLATLLFSYRSACCSGTAVTAELCPVCGLDVLRDTPEVDNKVVLLRGGKKTEYRCVLCALAEVKADKDDLTIVAPSEKKGKAVKIVRTATKWAVEPESAEFVYVKGSHSQCEIRYRAVTTKEALEAYVKTKPAVLRDAKLISLSDLIKRSE